MPATIEAAKAGATTGEWAGVLREAFGDYRAPTGVGGAAPAGRPRAAGRGPRAGSTRSRRRARPPDQDPGRKAGARRPLQRLRAGRAAGPRRRHGGRLPGHPPHPGGDRRVGAAGGRRRGRALDPLRLAHAAGPRGRAPAARAGRRRAGRGRRHHPRRRRGAAAGGRRGRRLHAARTSRSTGSWATSSSWSRSETAPQSRPRPDPGPP